MAQMSSDVQLSQMFNRDKYFFKKKIRVFLREKYYDVLMVILGAFLGYTYCLECYF